MADGEHPLARGLELPHEIDHPAVVPQVLWRASTEHEHRIEFSDPHVIERHIRVRPVSGALDVGVPPGLEIVDHEMEPRLLGAAITGRSPASSRRCRAYRHS